MDSINHEIIFEKQVFCDSDHVSSFMEFVSIFRQSLWNEHFFDCIKGFSDVFACVSKIFASSTELTLATNKTRFNYFF